jgi:hypothetical protein
MHKESQQYTDMDELMKQEDEEDEDELPPTSHPPPRLPALYYDRSLAPSYIL